MKEVKQIANFIKESYNYVFKKDDMVYSTLTALIMVLTFIEVTYILIMFVAWELPSSYVFYRIVFLAFLVHITPMILYFKHSREI